jgi:PIN domain nuclease of toxin-antitoxin system
MKFLLDTHTFLWFVNDSPQLSVKVKSLLESDVAVSADSSFDAYAVSREW